MKNSYCRHPVTILVLMAAMGVATTVWPAAGADRSPDGGGEQDLWVRYDIILKRNIFSRNRQPFQRERQVQEEPKQVVLPDPESYYILKGIVQEDSEFIAFIEDKRNGSILRLRAGESIARGTIKALSLDTLEYQMAEEVTTVRLGSDLQGGYGAVTATDLMEWSQTSTTTPPPAQTGQPAPSADEADILKRLMEQRRQQLGQ